MYWIFHLIELQALGFMDRIFSKSADEIEATEELVLDSDAARLEVSDEMLNVFHYLLMQTKILARAIIVYINCVCQYIQ